MGAIEFWSNVLTAWAWPVTVIALGIVFRKPLRKLIRRLENIRAGNTEAKFAQRQAKAERAADALSGANGALGAAGAQARPATDASAGGDTEPTQDQAPVVDPNLITMRREDLERIVRDFAEAGFTIRDLGGWRSAPEPVIYWQDGQPSISYWKGTSPGDLEVVDRLNRAQQRVSELAARLAVLDAEENTIRSNAHSSNRLNGEQRHMLNMRMDDLIAERAQIITELSMAQDQLKRRERERNRRMHDPN